jgi:hypothetical protein
MCTWRQALIDFFTFKWLKTNSQQSEKAEKPEQLKTIWKDTFNRLEAYQPAEPLHEHQPQVIQIAEEARSKMTGEMPAPTPTHKLPASKTCNDLQVWFGESVATWDPSVNAHNVDSSDQQSKIRRATRWTKDTTSR